MFVPGAMAPRPASLDGKTVYLTGSTSLYRLTTRVPGDVAVPQKIEATVKKMTPKISSLRPSLRAAGLIGARGAAVTSTLSYASIFVLVTIYFRMKTGHRSVDVFLLRRDELHDLLATFRRVVFLK